MNNGNVKNSFVKIEIPLDRLKVFCKSFTSVMNKIPEIMDNCKDIEEISIAYDEQEKNFFAILYLTDSYMILKVDLKGNIINLKSYSLWAKEDVNSFF